MQTERIAACSGLIGTRDLGWVVGGFEPMMPDPDLLNTLRKLQEVDHSIILYSDNTFYFEGKPLEGRLVPESWRQAVASVIGYQSEGETAPEKAA